MDISEELNFNSTEEIKVPEKITEQIIGQDKAVEIIKKAAKQRRHVLLIGRPGTGKSMLGKALSEQLEKSNLIDVLSYPNLSDENEPIIKLHPSGKGTDLVQKAKADVSSKHMNRQVLFIFLAIVALLIPWWIRETYGDIMAAASLIGGLVFVGALAVSINLPSKKAKNIEPKLLVDTSTSETAPFVDATGAHAGALLGDVLHDPFQSGGLGTPAHLRVQAGSIHRANGGVLFIDETATLDHHSQQELLTTLQEKKYPITGQSERSAGAMVRTQPAPCDFILIAAGNTETIKKMHPALRSRIRGYGYEVYMNDTIPDTPENRLKLARFVAQEVTNDGKIPHFSKDAVNEIISEARKRASRKGYLTLVLRDLGGLVRAAGDLALEEGKEVVKPGHVFRAKKLARTLEQQIADDYIAKKKEYEVIKTGGQLKGRVNGLAVLGGRDAGSGIVLPIEAAVTLGVGGTRKIHSTGQLGKIAKEAITNVSAIIKKYFGEDMKQYDIYVQFLQTSEGVEGDSASIAIAIAILSALKNIPIRQDTALTGSLSIQGQVLPVGGITHKIEAAIEAKLKQVIVPEANLKDVVLTEEQRSKIKIIPAKHFSDIIEHVFGEGKELLIEEMRKDYESSNRNFR